MSDAQAEALQAYVKRGGKLIITQNIGTYDEMGRKRPRPALEALFGLTAKDKLTVPDSLCEKRFGRGRAIFLLRDAGSYYDKYRMEDQRDRFGAIVRRLNRGSLLHATNCPPCVELHPYRKQTRGKTRLILHFVNRGVAGHMTGIAVDLALPADCDPTSVRWLTPDGGGKQALPFRKKGGRILFNVPELSIYGIVLIV